MNRTEILLFFDKFISGESVYAVKVVKEFLPCTFCNQLGNIAIMAHDWSSVVKAECPVCFGLQKKETCYYYPEKIILEDIHLGKREQGSYMAGYFNNNQFFIGEEECQKYCDDFNEKEMNK